ncbi:MULTISPECIES: hypothetical protein [unclassified Guyparkeria]|uniref:hypothetical protein n=1 Tax=unclassified Guyparkeria TaxID=2626246 RepID=UPI0012E37B5C|nr:MULTISPECIES: hypothetical protein [unclassified Guyparkeria]
MIGRMPFVSRFFRKEGDIAHRTLILHVGMDKTGTSAIQQFIYKNRTRLDRDAGIYYPGTGMWWDHSHHEIPFSIFEMNGFDKRTLRRLLRKLKSEIRDKEKVVISSECLFKSPAKPNFPLFLDFVRSNFDDVEVLVYVRPQDDWVESRYKHSVLSGAEIPLEKLTKPQFCDYEQFVDRWARIFGEEHVEVRPYEKSQFEGGSIFNDFLSAIGVASGKFYELPERPVNESLNALAHDFKRLCNSVKFYGAGVDINSVLIEFSQRNKGARDQFRILSPGERAEILTAYQDSNRRLASKYVRRHGPDALFVKTADDVLSDSWKQAGELDPDQFSPVLQFFEKTSPKAFKSFEKSVQVARDSRCQPARDAARFLSEALAQYKNFHHQ